MRAVLSALILLLLALPPTASAAIEPAGKMTHDDQWSRYRLPITCSDGPECTAVLTFSYQFTGPYPKFERLGSAVVADTRTVTVPAGTHDVVVETAKVIEGIAKRGGSFYVDVQGDGYSARGFGNYARVGDCGKGSPLLMTWKGPGRLFFRADEDDAFGRVSGPVTRDTFMAQGTTYEVREGHVSYSYKGVTYTFAKGSRFIITCTGSTSVRRGASVKSPMLEKGTVRVTASRSRMRQPAAWVMTGEGNLGTRAKETTSFVVTRNAARRVSTLSMKKGRAGTVTPWNTITRSPCRAGEKLKVNARGVVSDA